MRSLLIGLLVLGTIPVSNSAIAKSWLSKLPSDNICSKLPSQDNCPTSNQVDTVTLKSGLWLSQIANILLLPKRKLSCWNQSSLMVQQNSICLPPWKELPNLGSYSKQIGNTSNSVPFLKKRHKFTCLVEELNSKDKVEVNLNLLPPACMRQTDAPLRPLPLRTKPIKSEQNLQQRIAKVSTIPKKFPQLSRSSLVISSPRNIESLCSTLITETNSCSVVEQSSLVNPAPETERIASPFGWRKRPYSGQMQFHKGVDYGAPLGTPVVAADNGIVINVVSGCADFGNRFCGSQFGNWIEIDHGNGKIATYGHLLNDSITVKKGMKVWKNQEIAKVGSSGWSTGAHLDFRLKVNGKHQNPADYVTEIAE